MHETEDTTILHAMDFVAFDSCQQCGPDYESEILAICVRNSLDGIDIFNSRHEYSHHKLFWAKSAPVSLSASPVNILCPRDLFLSRPLSTSFLANPV